MKLATVILIALYLMPSCKEDQPCTLEFKMVGVEVSGEILDDHYTIDVASGDTLRFNSYQHSQWYAVMTDQYRDDLKDEARKYRFEGLQNGQVRVSSLFEIGADDCHIYKVSGPDKL